MDATNSPYLIGLTGSIGSGKSTVGDILKGNYTLYNADAIALDVLDSEAILKSIHDRWGIAPTNDAKADRKAIAEYVFKDSKRLRYLESLLYPQVFQKMQEITYNCDQPILVFEVPLIFEKGLQVCFDHCLLIVADQEIRIKRVTDRSGINRSEILARMKEQMPDEQKTPLADYVIYNNGTLETLKKELQLWQLKLDTRIRKKVLDFDQIIPA